jgi:hypothetical protein
MKPTANGERLWKRIHVKVIMGKKTLNHEFRAPAQRGYTERDIEDTVEKMVEHLDKTFPYIEFRLVRLDQPNRMNFIATGNRVSAEQNL